MKVSVIIPAKNEEKSIASTIQSCLDQTEKPFEIIVVNDGSTDKTKDFVEMMRIRNPELKLINFDKGHSAAFARNEGAKIATGDVLVFLDADMIPKEKEFISKIDIAFSNQEVKAAYFASCGEYKTFIQRCQRVRIELTKAFLKQTGERRFSVNAIRADFFREIKGYNENIFYYEDAELTKRVQEKTEIRLIDTMVCHNEPASFGEFIGQSRNVGKGIGTSSMTRSNIMTLLYPHNPLFWVLFLLCLLAVPFSNTPFLVIAGVLVGEVLLAVFLTRDVLPSVFYLLVLSPIRAFIIIRMNFIKLFKSNWGLPIWCYGLLILAILSITVLPNYMQKATIPQYYNRTYVGTVTSFVCSDAGGFSAVGDVVYWCSFNVSNGMKGSMTFVKEFPNVSGNSVYISNLVGDDSICRLELVGSNSTFYANPVFCSYFK